MIAHKVASPCSYTDPKTRQRSDEKIFVLAANELQRLVSTCLWQFISHNLQCRKFLISIIDIKVKLMISLDVICSSYFVVSEHTTTTTCDTSREAIDEPEKADNEPRVPLELRSIIELINGCASHKVVDESWFVLKFQIPHLAQHEHFGVDFFSANRFHLKSTEKTSHERDRRCSRDSSLHTDALIDLRCSVQMDFGEATRKLFWFSSRARKHKQKITTVDARTLHFPPKQTIFSLKPSRVKAENRFSDGLSG